MSVGARPVQSVLPAPGKRRLTLSAVRLVPVARGGDGAEFRDSIDRRAADPTLPPPTWREKIFAAGWPLRVLLLGFPLWWVLGLNTLIFPLVAIPMAAQLRRWARQRPLRAPTATWMWLLFVVWVVLGLGLLSLSPPGTHPGSTSGRLISTVFTLVEYAAVTITLLYVANLPRDDVSARRIGRWLGGFFLTVVGGGFLGVVAPRLTFRSAIEYVLPHSIAANSFVVALVHPVTAQVQSVIGTDNGRPSAPFGYTNFWANALSILVLWFIAAWLLPARGGRRFAYGCVVVATVVPVVLSLNRGLWIGIGVSVLWLLGRMMFQGHLLRVFAGLAVGVVAVVAVVVSPLGGVIDARLQNGVSNDIRAFVDHLSIVAVQHSPVLGYGGNRHANGSASSIAVGPSPACPNCGDVATGSTGQLWATLFNQGLVGALLYFGFFAVSIWVYRKQRGALAEAALLSIALTFVYMLFYSAVPIAPTLSMIAVGMLWREREAQRSTARPRGVVAPRRVLPLVPST